MILFVMEHSVFNIGLMLYFGGHPYLPGFYAGLAHSDLCRFPPIEIWKYLQFRLPLGLAFFDP